MTTVSELLLLHLAETTVERNEARAALLKQSTEFEARLQELEAKIAEAAPPPPRKRSARP